MNTTYLNVCRAALVVMAGAVLVDAAAAGPRSGAVSPRVQVQAPRQVTAKMTPALIRLMREEAGPYRAWVFFADKGINTPQLYAAAIADLEASYNPRAVQRRQLRGLNGRRGGALFDWYDFPLVEQYVQDVQASGATLRHETTWLNAVSVEATADQLRAIEALSCVVKLQPVAKFRRREPVALKLPEEQPESQGRSARVDYGASAAQLQQINVVEMHDAGYTGDGVIIGILDTGFIYDHVAFNQPGHEINVIAQYDFVDDDSDVMHDASDSSRHGTLILGCIAPYMPGELIGGAYDASFILAKTEDTSQEVPAEEDSYVAGLQFIEANGADMTTSSLGYIDWYTQEQLDGLTAVTTIAVNLLTANGVHHCNAAGNDYHDTDPGSSSIIAPADGFQVITCGAATSSGSIASFSSDGPTADGRVKPEVLATGVGTDTVNPFSTTGYRTADGTSLSTPLVACAVACLVEAHPEWTVDEMREAIFFTADDYVENRTFDPLYVRGYGLVNAFAAIQDCNGNDIPDVIDIADGNGTDCNGNGILDSCDIDTGTAEDCNLNGLPDTCDLTPPGVGLTDTEPAALGWQDISLTGTPLGLSDDGETTVTMPFTTPTFPNASVSIDNNGGIGFVSGASLGYTNGSLPSSDVFGGAQALLAFWDDIDADTGDVYYETIGLPPNRTFIVEWYNRPHFSGDSTLDGDEVTFQIQIFETPTGTALAQFLYNDVDFLDPAYDNGASATVGYQQSADTADTYSENAPNITTGTVVSVVWLGEAYSQDENNNGIPDECEGLNCPEDIDGLNGVGQGDLNAVLNRWGDAACLPLGISWPCPEDLDELNGVGQGDLNMVLNRWGDPECE